MKIDASEFEGSVEDLSKVLERKLKRRIDVHHRTLQIDDDLPNSKVRDALKQALHRLEPECYRLIRELDSIKIKKLESRPNRTRQKYVTGPSAPQTLPYFFPS